MRICEALFDVEKWRKKKRKHIQGELHERKRDSSQDEPAGRKKEEEIAVSAISMCVRERESQKKIYYFF